MTKLITCIIVEDEPSAQEIISGYVHEFSDLQLMGQAETAIKALALLEELRPDLMFLDVNMPLMNGIELIKSLPNWRPLIVLTTAEHHLAADGFDLNVTDFLRKPVSFARFVQAINKVREKIGTVHSETLRSTEVADLRNNVLSEESLPGILQVKDGKSWINIAHADIRYIESVGDYAKIYLMDGGRPIVPHFTLNRLEDILPQPEFLRISRSVIIRRLTVVQVVGNVLTLQKGKEVKVGNKYGDVLDILLPDQAA